MFQSPFDTVFHTSQPEGIYAETDDEVVIGRAQNGMWKLWDVDDRIADRPALRFQRGSSFTEFIYEGGGGSVMERAPIPKGLVAFLEQKFLPPLNVSCSKHTSFPEVLRRCFQYLDYQEPYFFLVDMPVALTQDTFQYTYKVKKTGTILAPDRLESFEVQRGWKFPHYKAVHDLITDPRTAAVARGQAVPHYKANRNMTVGDILEAVSKIVFGDMEHLDMMLSEWMSQHYEDLIYDQRTDTQLAEEIRESQEGDHFYWMCVALGLFTWLKSPHGLKYLVEYHPIYYEILEWDYDNQYVRVREGSGGWAVVDGWTIYTGADVHRLDSVPPGTCCVSNQTLHCTRLVNVKAVMTPCYCGEVRDIFKEEYFSYDQNHNRPECRQWERENAPQMVFVSYAALDNILNKRDPKTPCQRFVCPNTKCSYHAGHWARVRALTDQRTKMLTASRPG